MGFDASKPVFTLSDKVKLKQVSSATDARETIEILLVSSLDMILSINEITKALIRLYGWQAGLHLCCSQTLYDFLTLRPNYISNLVQNKIR